MSQTYVAWNPCGCLGGAVVDSPEHRRDTAKAVGDFIRYGCRVELRDTGWVRSDECSFSRCVDNPDCVRAPKQRHQAKIAQKVLL